MASRQADGTLVAQLPVAATLSMMSLSYNAAAILKTTTELRWGAVVVVCSPGRVLLPLRLLLLLARWCRLLLLLPRLLLLLEVWFGVT